MKKIRESLNNIDNSVKEFYQVVAWFVLTVVVFYSWVHLLAMYKGMV